MLLLRSRTRTRIGRFGGLATGIAVLGLSWWLLAPTQLAGSTTFVTVDGTSMLPTLRRSDLVALRPAASYRVGEIVGYRSTLINRVVLHRIVSIKRDQYVFKGDNNSFLDPDRVRRNQIVGRLWFQLPKAGAGIAVLHVPWIAAALATLLVLALGLGGPRRAAETTTTPTRRRTK